MLQEMVHHSLQNIIKLIVPQGAMHHLTWSHGEADVNKMETDVVKQQAVVTLYSEKKCDGKTPVVCAQLNVWLKALVKGKIGCG